ncbi:MAG: protein kinase [Kofleriaceae bacterium]
MAGYAATLDLGPQFAPGMMFGKYELLTPIGRGGMASVILARQRGLAGFEKVVVIKVIHPHLAQEPAVINMLLDEARLAARIDHPNVVQTYELGEALGTYYIAMEYLPGETLTQVQRMAVAEVGPPLTPQIAGRILADTAAGLHAAHELTDLAGNRLEIVHRDVSSANIIVLYNGTVKVVDFGVAKAAGRVTSTQDGELKGKYGYMSPEQIRNEPMDRRSDVFSLGVVLWESLTLKRLFFADNVGATLLQVLEARYSPPSHHRPEVPPELDAVTMKALAPDPRDRFQTAAEMKQAIEDAIWQHRCGTPEIERHMNALFGDRIIRRRELLGQVARESFSAGDFVGVGGAFEDRYTQPPPMMRRELSSWQRMALVLAGGLLTGGIAALLLSRPWSSSNPKKRPVVEQPAVAAREPAPAPAPTAELPAAAAAAAVVAPPPVAAAAPPVAAAAPPVAAAAPPVAAPPSAPPPVATELPPPVTPAAVAPAPAAAPEPAEPPLDPAPAKPTPRPKQKPRKPAAPVRQPEPEPEPEEEPPVKPAGSAKELYIKATQLYLAGEFAEAEGTFRECLAVDRKYAVAYRGLGVLYQRTGEDAKALDALRTYLKLRPNAKDADSVRDRIEKLQGG